MLAVVMLLLSVTSPLVAGAGKVLVLMDSPRVRDAHSVYFQSLTDDGFQLTFRMADDPNVQLSRYGELLYEHVIVFAPATIEFGGEASSQEIFNYFDRGGNVLVAGSQNLGFAIADLATRAGFEYDWPNNTVVDHFHYYSAPDDHTDVIHSLITARVDSTDVIGSAELPTVLYRGIGMRMDPANPLTIPLLRAHGTAFSGVPFASVDAHNGNLLGGSIVLVGLMEGRNNARMAFTGSLDMFSNELMEKMVDDGQGKLAKSGNEQFALRLSRWTMQEVNALRVKSVSHNKVGEKSARNAYTITDTMEFKIEIEKKVDNKWVPYVADDVQLEFVRIDPFLRITMTGNKDGVYAAQFQVPDVCGVYKLVVAYNRLGWTRLNSVTQVSVRPFEHTQYERFIRSAYPYYASALSMMVSVLLFSCVFLYHREAKKEGG